MIGPKDFVEALVSRGVRRFTGVPCSFFQAAVDRVIDDPRLEYTIVPNEGAALALAAGAYLGGTTAAVLIQNSGLGNLINPLTSLNMIYRIPALLFISGRAYGVPDEPQHEVIGRTMGGILDAIGVRRRDLPADTAEYGRALDDAFAYMQRERQPFAFFVRQDTIDEYKPSRTDGGRYPMKRIDAIGAVMDVLGGDELVVATTGKPSRELFATRDRPRNFYMQGSMGHAISIGLGLALERPDRKVVVLDGDGAALMHLGALSSVGHYKPVNFVHVVLDNESYETTGDQDTTSPTTDLEGVARACGYRNASTVADADALKHALGKALAQEGPAFLRVKINRLATGNIGRISSTYTSEKIAHQFREAVGETARPAADTGRRRP